MSNNNTQLQTLHNRYYYFDRRVREYANRIHRKKKQIDNIYLGSKYHAWDSPVVKHLSRELEELKRKETKFIEHRMNAYNDVKKHNGGTFYKPDNHPAKNYYFRSTPI